MTTEIAVMNREAISLAADSAVTIDGQRGQKIFTSANKIFALSEHLPVGVMVYGNSLFMDVPWETVIKVYRTKLGAKTFSTVNEYTRDFIRFLDRRSPLVPAKQQDSHVGRSINDYFCMIRGEVIGKIEADPQAAAREAKVREACETVIAEHRARWKTAKRLSCMSATFRKRLRNRWQGKIREMRKQVFEKLPISAAASRHLTEIALDLFTKQLPPGISRSTVSGVVVAGFGADEFFLTVEHILVEGKISGKLRYERQSPAQIDFETIGSIASFAQSDMVERFIEGVDPDYQRAIERDFAKLLDDHVNLLLDKIPRLSMSVKKQIGTEFHGVNQSMMNEYQQGLRKYRRKQYVSPVLEVVSVLPKEGLAAMAESLVRLIAFKKKVTMESETVAEPIDVAVISKGDGFVWVRRKHYFDAALNPRFIARHYGGGKGR